MRSRVSMEGVVSRQHSARGITKLMSKTVLHADDSASVRRWVAEQLGDMDLKVISVADGEAALKVLQEAPCDLLLTDLEMPNLDGLSLVSRVRDLPMHRFLPVLILSCRRPTEFQPENRQGVTGWLIKGIEPDELRRWIRRVLPR
jgi:two-component system chemotaxis response regulator CheY